jgi:NodT family efflux transporter outer membrane factor (OMF) lipoprotein
LLIASCGAAALLTAAAGCLVGPDFRPPETRVPAGWVGTPHAQQGQPSVASERPADVARWWTNFQDPTLDALIERAVESNLDVRTAQLRVRQARAARTIAASSLLPSVNTSGSYRRSGTSSVGGGGTSFITGGTGGGGVIVTPTTQPSGGGVRSNSTTRDLWQTGLDASWEIDVFGGNRRQVEAAEADIEAAEADLRNVLVTLTSEVALNYIDLRSFQRQIAIAQGNLEIQQRTAELTHRKAAVGLGAARLDVANADAQVATTVSQIPALEAASRQAIYALSVLLGREPGTLLAELSEPGPIPLAPPEVPVGMPSDLLRRRPDIRRAEAQLHSATARLGVAISDLFPRFSLTGSLGLSGGRFESLGDIRNYNWGIGPSVSWPIFAGGRIRANIAVQTAAQEEAATAYEQTVLIAFQDVENALIAYAKEQQRRESLAVAVAANRVAVEQATLLYQQGVTDFLNLLNAQRSLLGSEDALAQSDRTIAADLVSLYKALGGGWEWLDEPAGAEAPPVPVVEPATTPDVPPTAPVVSAPSPQTMQPATTRPITQPSLP